MAIYSITPAGSAGSATATEYVTVNGTVVQIYLWFAEGQPSGASCVVTDPDTGVTLATLTLGGEAGAGGSGDLYYPMFASTDSDGAAISGGPYVYHTVINRDLKIAVTSADPETGGCKAYIEVINAR